MTVAGGGVGDGGPAVSASLGALGSLAFDRSGDLFVVDHGQGRIRRIRPTTGTIGTVAVFEPQLGAATISAGPSGQLLFGLRNQVLELEPVTGKRRLVAGSGETLWNGGELALGGQAAKAALGYSTGIAAAPGGTVVFADPAHDQILQVDAAGVLTRAFRMEASLAARGSPNVEAVRNLAVDAAGRLHFTDLRHSQVFRVESGRAIAVAGTGVRRKAFPPEGPAVQPQEGDGGPALSAPLASPTQIAFGPDGSLYFGEVHGSLRKVDPAGRISTVFGPRLSRGSITGVAVTPQGEVFFASNASAVLGQVFRLVSGGATLVAGSGFAHCCGDGGQASEAPLAAPRGVAVAPDGDLLVADSANDRIRRVSSRTGSINTVAGGGIYALPGSRKVQFRPLRSAPPAGRVHATLFEAVSPRFVAVDRAGNVFFSATDGPVYRVDAKDGALSALGAGRREMTAADSPVGFRGIGGIAVDSTGYLVVAAEQRIFRISPSDGIGVIAGTGREGFFGDGGFGTLADLSRPAWPVDDGRGTLYFVDSGNYRIRAIDRTGRISTVAGNGQSWSSGEGPALRESIGNSTGLAVDPAGDLLYAAPDNRIFRLSLRSGILRVVAGKDGDRYHPSPDGALSPEFVLGGPFAIAVDARGAVYFSEPDHDRVRSVRPIP